MLKTIIKCSAPSSIMVSASGVIAGTACATLEGEFHPLLATFCLICAACLQIWANLTYGWFLTLQGRKDYTDALFDPSDQHDFPLGPVLRGGATMALFVGLIIALAIVASGGWLVIVIGAAMLGLVYLMMGASKTLSSYPVKPFLDFLIMGPGIVMLTAYVQIGHMNNIQDIVRVMVPAAAMGVVIGIYVLASIMAHGYVLMDYDRSIGKRTFAQSYGKRTTYIFLWCALIVGLFAMAIYLKFMGVTNPVIIYGIPVAFGFINGGILYSLPHVDKSNWRAPQDWIMLSMLCFSIVMFVAFCFIDNPVKIRLIYHVV